MLTILTPGVAVGYNETMRRYFRFSLRSLFVVTTLTALFCWLAVPPLVKRYREYRERQNNVFRIEDVTVYDIKSVNTDVAAEGVTAGMPPEGP